MFGFVVADAGALSEEEKERYRAVYCGLCLALRDRYGQLSRACLTYDLTFFVLLCNSLHEPAETQGTSHCVMHPAPAAPRAWARSAWTDYAADLSVALAYHKVLDDVADDGDLAARAAERLLAGAYERARARIPEQCAEIERAMAAIRAIEGAERNNTPALSDSTETACVSPLSADATDTALAFDPDAAAREFGRMLGRLFAHNQGFWTEAMEELGRGLGALHLPDGCRCRFQRRRRFGQLQSLRDARLRCRGHARHAVPRWPPTPPRPTSVCRWCKTRISWTPFCIPASGPSSTKPIRPKTPSRKMKGARRANPLETDRRAQPR